MAEDGHRVTLNVYDLSQGLARQLSMAFLGKAIEAIWHTGVVVYGNEYFFGGGIQHAPAGQTQYGTPMRVVELGVTHVPKEVFEEYLQEISSRYTAETYKLLSHNCNNFSNEVAQFLVGSTIPNYILQLPNEVINSPMGALMLPMIEQLETTMRSGAVPQAPQFRSASVTQTVQKNVVTSPSKVSSDSLKPNEQTAPQFRSASVTQTVQKNVLTSPSKVSSDSLKPNGQTAQSSQVKVEDGRPSDTADTEIHAAKEDKKPPVVDPLGDARSRVQEEITKEFAAIMSTGTLRASEAAALATRRVMERHGRVNTPMQQG